MTFNNDPRITQELLKARFTYDPESGKLVYRVCCGRCLPGREAGTIDRRGYRVVNVLGQPRAAHRLIWIMMTGAWPSDEIDHINRVKGDDRWANLRDVSKSDNIANAGARADSRSGARGVVRFRKGWKAEVGVRGARYHLGVFATKEEAAAAHDLANEIIRRDGPPIELPTPARLDPDPLAGEEPAVFDLWMAGLTPTQIGLRLGRSMTAVSNSARRIREKGHPLPRLKRRAGSFMAAFAPQGGGE